MDTKCHIAMDTLSHCYGQNMSDCYGHHVQHSGIKTAYGRKCETVVDSTMWQITHYM